MSGISLARRSAAIASIFMSLVLNVEANQSQVEAALTNIMTLQRPGQTGLATIWDGNKYVQCRPLADRSMRCEAAGTLMQPSLRRVLSADRIARLGAQGWRLNP